MLQISYPPVILYENSACMGFHLLIRYVENLRRQGNPSPTCFVVYNQQTIALFDDKFTAENYTFFVVNAGILLSMWGIYIYPYIYMYISKYTRVLSIVSKKQDEAHFWWVWNHVSILLDVSNMHLFWCKLSWMGPWGFHRIASSEDIPRQGPHPSGTLENNRLCPLTDCWQHASHFLKHLESCLQKTIKLRQREAYMGF